MSPKSKIDPVFRQEILHTPPEKKACSDVELNSVILNVLRLNLMKWNQI